MPLLWHTLYLHCPCTLHSQQEMVTFTITHQIQLKHMLCQVYHQNTGCSSILHPYFSYMLWQVRKMWRNCTSHWQCCCPFSKNLLSECDFFFFFSIQYKWYLAPTNVVWYCLQLNNCPCRKEETDIYVFTVHLGTG